MPQRLFRLDGAQVRDPAIDAWLRGLPAELGALAQIWFEFLRALGTDVREVMHDGHPTACVGTAAFAYVGAFTAHVNIGFFHGAELNDPEKLLQGSGTYMRHVKLRPGDEVDATALRALIELAYADVRQRIRAIEPPRRLPG